MISSKPNPLHTVRRVRISRAIGDVDSVWANWPHNPLSRKIAPTSSVVGIEAFEKIPFFADAIFSARKAAALTVVVVSLGVPPPDEHDARRAVKVKSVKSRRFICVFPYYELALPSSRLIARRITKPQTASAAKVKRNSQNKPLKYPGLQVVSLPERLFVIQPRGLPSPSSRGRRKVPHSPAERSLKMMPKALKYNKAETIVATMAWYRNGIYLHEYRLVIHLSSSSVDICYPLGRERSCLRRVTKPSLNGTEVYRSEVGWVQNSDCCCPALVTCKGGEYVARLLLLYSALRAQPDSSHYGAFQ